MSDQQQPTPPLWRVMEEANIRVTAFYRDDEGALMEMPPDEITYAAELRAIADGLRQAFPKDPRELRACRWLLSEADRAERGE